MTLPIHPHPPVLEFQGEFRFLSNFGSKSHDPFFARVYLERRGVPGVMNFFRGLMLALPIGLLMWAAILTTIFLVAR